MLEPFNSHGSPENHVGDTADCIIVIVINAYPDRSRKSRYDFPATLRHVIGFPDLGLLRLLCDRMPLGT